MTIYIVSKQGVEWNDPVVCMGTEEEANAQADNLNAVKEKTPALCGRLFPKLSKYVVTQVTLTETIP